MIRALAEGRRPMHAATRAPVNPPSTASRLGFFVAAAVVAGFVVLEYVYDWPIHLAR